MKIRHIIMAMAAGLIAAPVVSATDYHLADGSVLTGFVQEMPLASANSKAPIKYKIVTSAASIVVPDSLVNVAGTTYFKAKSQCDEKWVQWADANNAWDYSDNTPGLFFMNNIGTKYHTYSNPVHVIATGSVYKFIDLSNDSFSVASKDIVKATDAPRASNALSGLVYEYRLKNSPKVIKGQLVSTSYNGGSTTITVLDTDGLEQTIAKSNIQRISISGLNPEQTFAQQSPYIDMLVTKDGVEEGFIVGQNFKDYTIDLLIDRNIKSFPVSKITSMNKKENTQYSPLYDVILTAGEVQSGQNKTDQKFAFKSLENYNVVMPADTIPADAWLVVKADRGDFSLYTKLEEGSNSSSLYLLPVTERALGDIPGFEKFKEKSKLKFGSRHGDKKDENKSSKRSSKKSEKKAEKKAEKKETKSTTSKPEHVAYTFSTNLQKIVKPTATTLSRNGITHMEFTAVSEGLYVLYDQSTNLVTLIQVK